MRKFREHDWSGKQYHTVHIPASNTGVFSHAVVEAYGHNFDVPLTKHQGLRIEFGQPVPDSAADCGSTLDIKCRGNLDATEPCQTSKSVAVHPLAHFASVTYFWGSRYQPFEDEGDVDIYNNGLPRRPFLYPAYGVIKLIVWDGSNCDGVVESEEVKQSRDAYGIDLCKYPEYDNERHVCPMGTKCINCELAPETCAYPPEGVTGAVQGSCRGESCDGTIFIDVRTSLEPVRSMHSLAQHPSTRQLGYAIGM